MTYSIYPLGDQALTIELESELHVAQWQKLHQLTQTLENLKPDWLIEYIPAMPTLTIVYNPLIVQKQYGAKRSPYEIVCEEINILFKQTPPHTMKKVKQIDIPVCYGGQLGPDLLDVAQYTKLTPKEVIQFHSERTYTVYMIGCAPGFPYLGELNQKLHIPRRTSPRLFVPAGSVGIGGEQTGVYPLDSPGDWQIIGQTPLTLFLKNAEPPSLLKSGDQIRFVPISEAEYATLRNKEG
ncbi:5-oxoprolinase subunit PxpB [Peribacillus asahii]|uniref:5-oxoprolinase subunit PxpB n=1 Tax=Peribacillus asahii TaxID=228899 RepID=A0A398AZX3_9BACI|nr:5-oxoprolinase subunit PxpB [Peribacillus asahii]RID82208.1 5-oxoprolinase subunit PxpB [Peribacillus asahii]